MSLTATNILVRDETYYLPIQMALSLSSITASQSFCEVRYSSGRHIRVLSAPRLPQYEARNTAEAHHGQNPGSTLEIAIFSVRLLAWHALCPRSYIRDLLTGSYPQRFENVPCSQVSSCQYMYRGVESTSNADMLTTSLDSQRLVSTVPGVSDYTKTCTALRHIPKIPQDLAYLRRSLGSVLSSLLSPSFEVVKSAHSRYVSRISPQGWHSHASMRPSSRHLRSSTPIYIATDDEQVGQ
ncbi:hypothetical protein KCU61_g338, partial [Aureobasidium melanogenum]